MINKIFGPILRKLPENNKLERIWILAKTDFRKRYYGTSLGVVWAVINPFFRLLIYYFVFTVFFKIKIENYALYLFSGLIIWFFFSESTKKSFSVIKSKRYIIENIGINKLDLFTSSILSTFLGFIFNFIVYLVFSAFFPVQYTLSFFIFVFIVLNLMLLVYAINLILATIHIYLKDLTHVWDMVLLILFWTSPIFYGREVIFKEFAIIGYINPLAGIISNTREVLLYGSLPDWTVFFYDYFYSIILLIMGLFVFKLHSRKAIELL